MSVVWHIVRKDITRLKWILVLWAVVLAAGLALVTIQAGLDADTYFPFWVVTAIVGVGFLPLFSFGIVMGLLHDDPVAEIDAFWITRPISGGELLAAKALGLFLVSLVPVLVMLPFWLAHDYSFILLAHAVGETLLSHGLIMALALPFALVSANGSKFVMNVMLGAGGLLLLCFCLQLGSPRTWNGDPGVVLAKSWLITWLWIAVSVFMALNQFLGRRLRRSLGALALGLVAGLVVSVWWSRPLDFLKGKPAAFGPVLAQGAPTLAIRINGEISPAAIVGQVPLRGGATATHRGVTLKVQTVFVDYTGELQVSFSEAAARPARGLVERLPKSESRPRDPVHYVLLNPSDGVILPVKPEPVGNPIEVAAMRFTHAGIHLRPAGSWQGTPPENLKAWLQDAWLVKVIALEPAPSTGDNS